MLIIEDGARRLIRLHPRPPLPLMFCRLSRCFRAASHARIIARQHLSYNACHDGQFSFTSSDSYIHDTVPHIPTILRQTVSHSLFPAAGSCELPIYEGPSNAAGFYVYDTHYLVLR